MNTLPEICAVVVTYHPEPEVAVNIRRMQAECGRVIVVDNGSSEARLNGLRQAVPSGVEFLPMESNRGIAAALNAGIARAASAGIRKVVTFDQDSRPRAGMVRALLATADRFPRAAVIGPRIVENEGRGPAYRWVRFHRRWRFAYERRECGQDDLDRVLMVISSGSLVDVDAWQKLGGFEADLFIDYVDVDYCLRAVRAGFAVVVSAAAELDHRLGAREPGEVLGHAFRPTHHAAFRHYYIARNRVHLWRRHARALPGWSMFDAAYAGYNLLRVTCFERHRWRKWQAMVLGTWDGWRGQIGPCPEARWRRFQ